MTRPLLPAALALAAAFASPAGAQESPPGRNLAAACANCHGTNGVSQAEAGLPSLAGRERSELAWQMQDFKTGKRPATVMHQIARGYTDGQIEAIAAYLSAQKAPR